MSISKSKASNAVFVFPRIQIRQSTARFLQDCCCYSDLQGARNGSYSSPVLAGDRLYVANKNADVFVLQAAPKFECLAINSIGGEPMNASLAVSDGAIFIRTDRALWCIARDRVR